MDDVSESEPDGTGSDTGDADTGIPERSPASP
jgi:hypothetical protein